MNSFDQPGMRRGSNNMPPHMMGNMGGMGMEGLHNGPPGSYG